MKLSDFPHLIKELNDLATTVDSSALVMEDNIVYKAIQSEVCLNIVGEDLSQESWLLFVKIAAKSPALQTIIIIGQHEAPTVVVELTKLKPQKSMNLDGINTDEYDSLTFTQLTESLPLEITIASELYGLSFAIALAKSSFSLNKLYIPSSLKGIVEKVDSHNNFHQLFAHLDTELPLLGDLRELVAEYFGMGQHIELFLF